MAWAALGLQLEQQPCLMPLPAQTATHDSTTANSSALNLLGLFMPLQQSATTARR